MKKTLKLAAAAVVLATPAVAAPNVENPLYTPTAGDFYTKIGAGVMIKKTDDSLANRSKDHDGAIEFPIGRGSLDVGYGITDRLSANGQLGWTQDDDINRKGLHNGRVGLNYRIFEGVDSPFVWDVYADAHLGGVSTMEAELVLVDPAVVYPPIGFSYDNYTNGRYGVYLGTKVGKTWGKFTGAAFVEVQRTFGNDNNSIRISDPVAGLLSVMGIPSGMIPDEFSVMLGSTWEVNTGLKGFYEFNDDWSMGGSFTYKHHSDNTVEDVQLGAAFNSLKPSFMGNMKDGWDEYIIGLSVANQLTESIQVALYGEYTFDESHEKSQNGTDLKAEAGVRANIRF